MSLNKETVTETGKETLTELYQQPGGQSHNYTLST